LSKQRNKGSNKTFLLILLLIIIAFLIASYSRNMIWKDDLSLWEDIVKKSPNKARGYNNLGTSYGYSGWIDMAIKHFVIINK